MDIRMPGADGIAATCAITSDPSLAGTRVLVLTKFNDDDYPSGALRAGSAGFALKDSRPELLIAAIRRTHVGESPFAPQALIRLVDAYLAHPTTRKPGPASSARLTISALHAPSQDGGCPDPCGANHARQLTADAGVGRAAGRARRSNCLLRCRDHHAGFGGLG